MRAKKFRRFEMAKLVEGKVALITGAAGGIGREHALMLASHGAKIVVNDLGGDLSGQGEDLTQAQRSWRKFRLWGAKPWSMVAMLPALQMPKQ